jgi:hypothetical protein
MSRVSTVSAVLPLFDLLCATHSLDLGWRRVPFGHRFVVFLDEEAFFEEILEDVFLQIPVFLFLREPFGQRGILYVYIYTR